MGRHSAGWILIIFGLAGIVNGIAMAYIFTVINQVADAEKARAQERMDPGGVPAGPARRSEALWQYGSAAASGIVGLVLTCWGVGLRGSGQRERKLGSRTIEKRTCTGCVAGSAQLPPRNAISVGRLSERGEETGVGIGWSPISPRS